MADRSERIRQQYCSTRVIGAMGTRWEHLMADRGETPIQDEEIYNVPGRKIINKICTM